MPSASLQHWQSDRMPRLTHIDAQCGVCVAAVPPNPPLIEENLRGICRPAQRTFSGLLPRPLFRGRPVYRLPRAAETFVADSGPIFRPPRFGPWKSKRGKHRQGLQSLRLQFAGGDQRGPGQRSAPAAPCSAQPMAERGGAPRNDAPYRRAPDSPHIADMARFLRWPGDISGWDHVQSVTENIAAEAVVRRGTGGFGNGDEEEAFAAPEAWGPR